jgi:hypothetical protein
MLITEKIVNLSDNTEKIINREMTSQELTEREQHKTAVEAIVQAEAEAAAKKAEAAAKLEALGLTKEDLEALGL